MSVQVFCPFLSKVSFFCCLVLVVFCILILYHIYDLQIFFSFCELHFYSVGNVLIDKFFFFMRYSLSIFPFVTDAIGVISKKSFLDPA